MFNHYVITIGASAGGIETLRSLLGLLPREFAAAVLVVNHISPQSKDYLVKILTSVCNLPVQNAKQGQALQAGNIFVAPPDHHLLIDKNNIQLYQGPKVNNFRPAIDPLFRSAAFNYKKQVIGILLSGMLDDGTAGCLAIKKNGGIVIVQDPKEALFSEMPLNALQNVTVDYCLKVADIAELLTQLVHDKSKFADLSTPPSAEQERKNKINTHSYDYDDISEKEMGEMSHPSSFSCPECHGVLWEINEEKWLLFRCRVGHTYGLNSLMALEKEHVEDALWAALRSLEEKANLARRIAERAHQEKFGSATIFQEKAERAKSHAQIIREILLNMNNGKKE